VFERFTERARQVVVLAQEEARTLKHNYIGTEHVLLGLLREEEGLAARALESLDITVERVRAQVLRIVGQGEEVTSGQIPFTPRAKKVLELALREALSLGHNYIGTEHVLLGLVRENEGVAARILLDFDAEPEKIRNEVIRLLSGPAGARSRAEARTTGRSVTYVSHGAQPPGLDDPEAMLGVLEHEIRAMLGREPDRGDLLVILATVPEGVVARAFAELGITDEALDAALATARADAPDSIQEQLERARRKKDEAIDAGEFPAAVKHREEERRLTEASAGDPILRVRVRLGLVREEGPGPSDPPASDGPPRPSPSEDED
jgi:hypothetical protein